ncbi:hypothetical protein HDU83_003415 [Entophlyctis luteolus]|nr:hypothetical protein HDU82_008487 [Entophlyctis luteolus]KAJ3355438.1 hypothetical protein HDU83_003415 [Entophlyctis luteolus]KAJ3393436.1 hypothetical protein HDU84_001926 [Entophlyctis sp. JEL0112]
MTAVTLQIASEYGYVLAVLVAIYLQQNVAFVIPVVKARKATGIKAPSFYPRDSEIKALKLSPEQVESYMYAQRVHQNNMELMSFFIPLFLVAGLYAPVRVAAAGVYIVTCRAVYGHANPKSTLRRLSGLYHIGELYVVVLAGIFAFELVNGRV